MAGISTYAKHLHALRKRGHSMQEIAAEVGYTYSTVVRFFSCSAAPEPASTGADLQRAFEAGIRKRLKRRRD